MADIYLDEQTTSAHLCALMRRINTLEIIDQFARPYGIAVYGDKVYVTDGGSVNVFDLTGTYLQQWGGYATIDIAVYSDEVYVAGGSSVNVFDLTGTYLRQWGSMGGGDGQFRSAISIAVYGDKVYVADGGSTIWDNNRVQVFDLDGTYLRQWGRRGGGDGQFKFPFGIAVYGDEVYVTGAYNHRVQVFDLDGTYLRQWGGYGIGDGQFKFPHGIAVYVDEVYVTDYSGNRVQVFDLTGTYVRQWGGYGIGDGQFRGPMGIAVYGDEVYVTGYNGKRVQVFGLPGTYLRQWGGLLDIQTTFYGYTQSASLSLGIPDGGVSIPALSGLAKGGVFTWGANVNAQHVMQMWKPVQVLAPYFTNPATGNPFDWEWGSADNLFNVATGAGYGWNPLLWDTWPLPVGGRRYSTAAYEIDQCLTVLEAS